MSRRRRMIPHQPHEGQTARLSGLSLSERCGWFHDPGVRDFALPKAASVGAVLLACSASPVGACGGAASSCTSGSGASSNPIKVRYRGRLHPFHAGGGRQRRAPVDQGKARKSGRLPFVGLVRIIRRRRPAVVPSPTGPAAKGSPPSLRSRLASDVDRRVALDLRAVADRSGLVLPEALELERCSGPDLQVPS